MLAPLIGALILWLSDQIILWLARVWMEVSTGSVTALIGAPLLLWLLPRLRSISAPAMDAGDKVHAERQSVLWFSLAGLAVLLLASFAALSLGAMPPAGTGQRVICSTNCCSGAGRVSSPR
jgi:iron complex transport system permease protein